jgi:hypothetical protein
MANVIHVVPSSHRRKAARRFAWSDFSRMLPMVRKIRGRRVRRRPGGSRRAAIEPVFADGFQHLESGLLDEAGFCSCQSRLLRCLPAISGPAVGRDGLARDDLAQHAIDDAAWKTRSEHQSTDGLGAALQGHTWPKLSRHATFAGDAQPLAARTWA